MKALEKLNHAARQALNASRDSAWDVYIDAAEDVNSTPSDVASCAAAWNDAANP